MGFQSLQTWTLLLEGVQYFCTLYVHIKLRFKRSLKLTEVYSSYKDSFLKLQGFISKEVLKTRGISGYIFKINLDLCLKVRAIPPSPLRSGAPSLAPYTQSHAPPKLQVSPVSHRRAAGSIV